MLPRSQFTGTFLITQATRWSQRILQNLFAKNAPGPFSSAFAGTEQTALPPSSRRQSPSQFFAASKPFVLPFIRAKRFWIGVHLLPPFADSWNEIGGWTGLVAYPKLGQSLAVLPRCGPRNSRVFLGTLALLHSYLSSVPVLLSARPRPSPAFLSSRAFVSPWAAMPRLIAWF